VEKLGIDSLGVQANQSLFGKRCHRIQTKRKLVSKDFNQKAKALLEFSLKPWQRGI
jgi:hypothetical protein